MKRSRFFLTIGAAMMFLSGSAGANKPKTDIQGNYVEVRSCDVFTGSCFANGEMGLTGEEAILTWSITRGSWHGRHPLVSGVRLDGLNVIGVVKASATLGDSNHDPYPARSIIIVDHRANRAQREALVCFAKTMAGKLLANVVDVQVAPIKARIGACSKSGLNPLVGGCASVLAEGLVEVETRCLGTEDHVCGNEETFYPPLTKVDNAVPALTVEGSFKGDGLGVTWSDAGRRSAFLATFQR